MKRTILYIIGILLFIEQTAIAQQAITFIKGTGLAAETQVDGYGGGSGYIDIWNVSFGATNDKLIVSLLNLNKPNEKAKPGVLSFTKAKSRSSKIFHSILVTSAKFENLEIAFAKNINSGGYQTYMNYKAKDVYVISIKDNSDFTETIELLIPHVFISYKPTVPQTGQLGPQITYGWNFLTNVFWNGN